MRRRNLLGLAAALSAPRLWANHGWQPYASAPPLYLEGRVTMIIWADPHPHLELVHRPKAALPSDLNRRKIPSQKVPLDVQSLLSRLKPVVADDQIWRVELPTLARLTIWDLPRPKIGDLLGVIGFAGPPVTDSPTLRAEILYMGDRGYPLRSDPA